MGVVGYDLLIGMFNGLLYMVVVLGINIDFMFDFVLVNVLSKFKVFIILFWYILVICECLIKFIVVKWMMVLNLILEIIFLRDCLFCMLYMYDGYKLKLDFCISVIY